MFSTVCGLRRDRGRCQSREQCRLACSDVATMPRTDDKALSSTTHRHPPTPYVDSQPLVEPPRVQQRLPRDHRRRRNEEVVLFHHPKRRPFRNHATVELFRVDRIGDGMGSVWSVRGRCAIGVGSVWGGAGAAWGQCGVGVGSVWGQCGVSVGSVWGQCGVNAGSGWGRCGVWGRCACAWGGGGDG